ncbi:MAG: hypothetical protein L0Z50_00275 [Verrucomicrobiales bacterium]|nr:hypothetical protein [Verrucomicrobiales bacterium]
MKDYARAPISDAERALLDHAVKLTREPWACTEADVERLRAAGWSDRAILDLTLIVGYFAFVNRIADGLGVELEGGPERGSHR